MPTLAERQLFESVDDRMISMMRLILALSALLIIYIDPSEPDHNVALTYGTLVLYSLYSAVLYFLSTRKREVLPSKGTHWMDVACYLLLVSLSSGTSSIFFFFFFFAILVASFRWGFEAGFHVTITSAILFTFIGWATATYGTHFELNRFLLRPIYLLVLGYMIAYWGGFEIMLKRRLSLLKEVTRLSNPRFGIEHTLGSVIKRLRAFYNADRCLLIWSDLQLKEHRLISIERDNAESVPRAERIPDTLAQLLLTLPEDIAVIYNGKQRFWSFQNLNYYGFDLVKRARSEDGREASESLAARLEATSFASIPLKFRGVTSGRLYLTAGPNIFSISDADFLMQIIEQVAPILDNIRLLERLASSAAEQERQRLARDIHDSVIQPYLGLQYRLAAIRNKIAINGGDVVDDIERLFQSTVEEVNALRGFVRGLKDTERQRDELLPALRRLAAQFTDSYGINVQVERKGDIPITDHLAAEVIQIINEGLSNIRKHTQATHSTISLECNETALLLCIENNGIVEEEAALTPFSPRSIAERVEELGGYVRVERSKDGRTTVKVEIPL
jgi:signal transduction histidine kinase